MQYVLTSRASLSDESVFPNKAFLTFSKWVKSRKMGQTPELDEMKKLILQGRPITNSRTLCDVDVEGLRLRINQP